MKNVLCIVAIALMVTPAYAITLDGSISGDAYTLRKVQTVQTGFGDNSSELNAAWVNLDGTNLNLVLTGNLEGNFNKLNVFIDTGAGGQNVIGPDANNFGNNPENDGWANAHNGFTFDSNFDANYLIILRNGAGKFDIDFATVGGGLGAFEDEFDVFSGSQTGANASALPLAGIGVAFDNSNGAGVGGDGSSAANPVAAAAVQTGIELSIPLAALGNPALADIKISAMINGSNHDFVSNQILGGLPAPQSNLGGDGNGNFTGNVGGVDLNNFGGDQWFAVIPEPASFALAGLAVVGLCSLRRRS